MGEAGHETNQSGETQPEKSSDLVPPAEIMKTPQMKRKSNEKQDQTFKIKILSFRNQNPKV